MSNIKISQLNAYPTSILDVTDFFPIDQSSSLTTYRATLQQLRTTLFTGSLYGTSSWATNALTASFLPVNTYQITSSWAQSASVALTASYAANVLTNGITGSGTINYLPIWTGNTSLGNSNIYYTASRNAYKIDNTNLIVNTGAQSFIVCRSGGTNSNLLLESAYSASDAWIFAVGTGNFSGDTSRGILDFSTYSGSNQLISKQPNDPDGYGTIRSLRIASNGFYFWPLGGAQSVSRDGTFNIGVDSGIYNTSTRLLIDVYSGSSVSNPQTYHLQKAIEVRYGSSSLNTTFCVSSSGYVYSTGYNVISSSNYAYTSSLASGSFAVLEDNGVMFLFARSANGRLRSASLA